MKLKYIFTLPLFFSTVACSDDSPQTPDTSGQPDSSINVEKTVTIDAGQSFQTLTGFGASDCWAPAFVGIVTKSVNCYSLLKYNQDNLKV